MSNRHTGLFYYCMLESWMRPVSAIHLAPAHTSMLILPLCEATKETRLFLF